MGPVFLISQNDILKQLFTLFICPCIIPLKYGNTILVFIRLNVIVQHSSAVDLQDCYPLPFTGRVVFKSFLMPLTRLR